MTDKRSLMQGMILLSSFLLKPTEVEIYFFGSATTLSTCRTNTSTQLLYKKIAKNVKIASVVHYKSNINYVVTRFPGFDSRQR